MRSPAILLLLALFFGCNSLSKNSASYQSLSTFPEPLQTHLRKIVEENMLYNGLMWEEPKAAASESYLYNKTAIADLIKVSKSEHAILRTLANEILMEKPGDTSISSSQRKELTDLLIREHPYLRAAYTSLFHLPAEEKYYPFIRKMTEAHRDNFDESQFAVYALSRYHRQEDVSYIKAKLISGDLSPYTAPVFFLMIDNPDTAYFPALQKFFYRTHFNDCRPDISYYFSDCFRMMANAIATYQTPEAATLLSLMLTDPRFGDCRNGERNEAAFAIINHPCPAFEKLMPLAISMIQEKDSELNSLEKIKQEATRKKPIPPPQEKYYVETRGWW